jgi:iron complex transport system substrate-binding protein
LLCAGCGSKDKAAEAIDEKADSILEEHKTVSMELEYADQFHVDYYEDGIAVVTVEDGLQYLVIEGSDELPEWLPDEEVGEMTIICAPARSVYLAASSAMDLIDAAGALDSVKMTSTQAKDWGID